MPVHSMTRRRTEYCPCRDYPAGRVVRLPLVGARTADAAVGQRFDLRGASPIN